ncbi:restriction endonuclease subunit S [Leyella stercorea]|uniref:restriction endonuclease subunit S n=1 Tax=Leyella stercorea TaxID=363265 RepID=UPI002432AE91|nr:restriction endonuclease subunit S [Leyella stercorea]
MNTKALRQKILDLAIHGKLVPQDPNDEPASVLLERIRDEKERLIKEGKIKRPKKTKTTSDKPHYENVPFEVPSSWGWCKLHDIIQITNGRSQKDVENVNGKYPIYGSGGIIGKAVEYLCEAGSTIIGRKGTINNPLFVEERFWNIDTAFGMKPMYAISDLYFFYFCQYFDFSKLDKSTAVPSLTQSAIGEVFIPIPPINEQKHITDGISYWFGFIDTLESNLNNLQLTIKQTKSKILDLAIHGQLVPQDPTDEPASELLKRINPKAEITCDNGHYQKLPEGWAVCCLENVAKVLDNLRKPINSNERNSRIANKHENELFPYYGATGQVGFIDDYLVDGTFLLLGEDGAPFLDKYAIKSYPIKGKCWVNNHAHILDPQCDFDYLIYYLNHVDYKDYVNGSTRLKLTQSDMRSIIILLPPLTEQHIS